MFYILCIFCIFLYISYSFELSGDSAGLFPLFAQVVPKSLGRQLNVACNHLNSRISACVFRSSCFWSPARSMFVCVLSVLFKTISHSIDVGSSRLTVLFAQCCQVLIYKNIQRKNIQQSAKI